ncbi:unnamed protein product [Pleuronectes platessa]|uniref:Uncharacterized protein n=1 Tax=Pleuronectes platessa TaxID=8262 RepID=A0A9N7YRT8_PLEPL|nr:unnamed protein product [Pleuronectes platessa]
MLKWELARHQAGLRTPSRQSSPSRESVTANNFTEGAKTFGQGRGLRHDSRNKSDLNNSSSSLVMRKVKMYVSIRGLSGHIVGNNIHLQPLASGCETLVHPT